ncbi:MAG: superoxide dismutase [Phycisphaerae bacterium]|nr:superoxide dismutase [Phycisphaerae bacterium]
MWAGASAAGVATIGAPGGVALAAGAAGTKEYTLPPLPYEYNALEPVLDEKTMRIHHDKHHAGYVKGLNATLQKLEAARKAGDFSAVQALSRALAFHGSGHVLHSLYWENLNPEPSKPGGALHHAINDQFGGFETMTAQLAAATNTVAGSGWGLLAYEPLGKRLLILQIEKHENQMFCGATPILVIDVWEHAYYLKYQNMRADYVKALMKHVNWDVVTKRYDDLIGPQ